MYILCCLQLDISGENYLNIYYSVRPPMLAVKYENDMAVIK